jgi:hypothetical protein
MSAFLRKPEQHQERISLPLVTQGYLLAAPVGHYDWLVPDPLKGEIMIEILLESGGNLLAVMAHGEVTRDDYTEVLIPRLDEIIHQYGKARLLYAFADDFTGFTLGAMWDDSAFGLTHLWSFDKVAVVTDVGWIQAAVAVFGPLMSGRVRLFAAEDLGGARSWPTESCGRPVAGSA